MDTNWEQELAEWLDPFLEGLGHKSRQRWAPVYLRGLIGPGERKSVQPMSARLASADHEQLHHFRLKAAGREKKARHRTQAAAPA